VRLRRHLLRRGIRCRSNDVTLDERGLIYVVDRNCRFDVLEFQR